MKNIIAILLFLPFLVSAHGTGGTYEKVVGEYFVDLGYSEPILRAGESSRFDFQLQKNADRSQIDFDQVWVRIIKDGNLVFVATLPKPSFGLIGMTYTFPEPGTYDLTLNYLKGGEKILETSFDIPIYESKGTEEQGTIALLKNPFATLAIGLVVGIGLTLVVRKKKDTV